MNGGCTPSNGAIYPSNGFGEQMSLIARLAKLDLGLRAAAIDLGGWNTATTASIASSPATPPISR